jgi:hypothetical protein
VKRRRDDGAENQDETDHHSDEHDICERVTDRVAYYAPGLVDADPVAHRVERSVNLLVIRDVEDLDDGEQADEDPGDSGHDAPWPGRQHQRHSH